MYYIDEETFTEIISHLKKLGNSEIVPIDKYDGVCIEIENLFYFDIMCHKDLYQGWQKYSGRSSFPVPHPNFSCPAKAYHRSKSLWENDTYGNNRREFCLYVAEQLEKYLNLK